MQLNNDSKDHFDNFQQANVLYIVGLPLNAEPKNLRTLFNIINGSDQHKGGRATVSGSLSTFCDRPFLHRSLFLGFYAINLE